MLKENDLVDTDLASGSLRDRLQKGPLGQEEALLILAQIGQALHAAHQQHIVHGHVAPERVLFSSRNEALLAGFPPPALLPPEQAEEGDSPQEAVYSAPEQLVDHTSEKSDQYALGCIAYEMFTGCKVFRVPSVSAPGMYYKTRLLIAPGKLNPALPSSIEKAILKALSREPARRHRDILAFLTALGAASATGSEDQEQVTMAFAQETQATPITAEPAREPLEAPETIAEPPYGADRTPALPQKKAWRKLTSRRQRILALIVCLVVAAVVADSLFLAFKFSTPVKPSRTVPTASATGIAQNGTSVPTVIIPVPPTFIPGQAQAPQRSGSRPTQTPISAQTQTPGPASTPTPTQTPGPLAVQVSLTSFFNNSGIGSAPGQADFDGSGYCYPADQVPAGGLITVDGVPYQFPGNAPLTNDNISAFGQTIPLPAGHYQQVFLLAAASWGPVSSTVTIRYTAGPRTITRLTVLDWMAGSSNALHTTYRYTPSGSDRNPAYIYVIAITLDATRTVSALVLPGSLNGPNQNGQMHVFAVTLQP